MSSNMDMFIELIRLSEQLGKVLFATANEDGACMVEVNKRNGGVATFTMRMEEQKNDHETKHC